ncbi:helix-turn-helix domain-containing protein [Bacillus atrophaeus]|uniref:cupin domain-containing protein n=1 Tax=Bacillus atrophaeus TaxID=1452 RepID=UPI00227EDB4D|nr:cupin domain-containing protein [Bacillus atrophaeus]MCY8504892.1 helix-turn-helix domain-containing protein [Bacillus atrophaeus]MCY8907670.1 helix-turn-helix domain-containing protein [Bacillus atrophaeus]MCY8949631.1 helix-turn-helix domain-containing protein [Bacillus atrophaeus]MCY8969698.1 helix-turn-helix domain-containing protein [Bacillus atrophaeus]MEC0835423.1 helix-turn-helix domain-containing protein [Bacillus atrophaeus]
MDNIDIGKKIANYRKAKGFSSKELANLSEITPSMLSQIERGLANPSIQTLKILAKNLNIPTFMFFVEDTETSNLVVKPNQRKKMIINNLSYELLSPDFKGNLATVIMNVPPNSASSEKLLEHKSEEIAYILQGKIKVYLNEDEYTLEAGDSVKIPTSFRHMWENPFDQVAVVLFSVTPPIF